MGKQQNISGLRIRQARLQNNLDQVEWFAPLRLSMENIQKLRRHARHVDLDPHDLLNQAIDEFFQARHDKTE